ncbi:MAG TPA: ATP-dependent DNA helicase RecQ, partial [Dehalococcoidia bacterium]
QREAIDELMKGRGQVLVVAPTGGGKSMCYQQPAVDLDGVALVITPLVALMADQVASLTARDIPATYLASNLDPEENRRRAEMALTGRVKLLYLAPERLASERFVEEVLAKLPLSLLAVDEAHCISHWGHDFRPDYLQLGSLVQRLNPPRLLACTATATPAVRREIVERLQMPDAYQVLRGFARDNLELTVEEVSGPKAKEQRIIDEVKRVLVKPAAGNGSAIVYTSTRKSAEDVAEALRHTGWHADHYHAGMGGDERTRVQEKFQAATLDVVTATNAFGMGIDRPDIRLVLHHALTESVEAYYQEVGRAGRDGDPARGLLLLSDPDIAWRFKLIAGDAEQAPEMALHHRELLRAMIGYAETSDCRHDTILRYFEDEAEALGGCGQCDNCRARRDAAYPVELSEEASTGVIQKVIAAIRALPFAAGAGSLAAFLLGNPSRQVQKYDWHRRGDFGVLRESTEDAIKRLLRRMIAGGLLAVDPEHATLQVTRRAVEVERGTRPNTVRLPAARVVTAAKSSSSRAHKPPIPAGLDAYAAVLFEKLKEWRLDRATKDDVPPYVIFHDSTLRAIADALPDTTEALLSLGGVGPSKADKYGPAVLACVHVYVNAQGARPEPAGTPVEAPEVRSFHEERILEARKAHPRAYEKWDDGEDARLRGLIESGERLDDIVRTLERQPNAILMRARRLELEDRLVQAG